jgi:osmoprotectant transport system ATP-binding protein
VIEFESVSKTFRDGTTAVDNLNLVVPSGKITVIVGPSGCGKTTTLRMVNRMLEPSKGKITWDGKAVKSRRKTALRRQMGYVIQSGGLFPHRTVLENIATVPELLRWDKLKSRKRAAELLGSVGLDRKLGSRYPAQLSGGQQQRVGVARALAADPLVLLMDEPFSAVDPVVRGELHEFFLGLQRQLSKTIIMITHDIDEAIKLGDQVAILRVGGRLAQVGTPQQLLDEPADSFVEGFVGRDRGYRSLSFQPASGLSLGDVQVVRDAGYAGGANGPVLVVDGDAQPVGWADPVRPGSAIALGATFNPETDSLRAALDAALTSPVGLAVAVTGDPRRYAGVVDADMILRQVTQARAQIAESIAVRAQDTAEQASAGSTPTEEQADDGQVHDGQAYDPDATSIREPLRSESEASAEPASDAEAHDAQAPEEQAPDNRAPDTRTSYAHAPGEQIAGSESAEEQQDPDATRITPIPTDWDTDPDATRAAGPLPEVDTPTTVDEAPATDQPEPYGAEAPSTEDQTVATAYDARLADHDMLSDREWQTAAEDAPETPEQSDPEPAPDDPSSELPAQDVESEEQPAPDEQPAPSQEPAASDDHDREPPR